ncbi:MAG: 4-hydroxythreonine-4-phosphate dehydrogenase PdxA [Myxococcota bacterium]
MSERGGPLRLGVTIGDPAGIGPEVVSAALRMLKGWGARFRVYGDIAALERAGGLPEHVEVEDTASASAAPGQPDPATAAGVIEAIQRAARDCLSGGLDAMVTGPISKQVIGQAGFPYPGHTELLQQATAQHSGRTRRAVMLLVGGSLRVGLATVHCALRDVPDMLTREGLFEVLSVMHRDLVDRFRLPRPRIAVCGLNPHAGEGGRFGDEELRTIEPAVSLSREAGIEACGPLPADSLFHRAASGEFDAVLGMYHDQALGPLKLHAFGKAVNVTLGLPFIRTSVDHGTAFDIAGTGRANPVSMLEALRLARELAAPGRVPDGKEG